MHVLITGISGQIGTRLVEVLQERGIPFRGLDLVKPDFPCDCFACDLTRPLDEQGLGDFLAPVTHVVHLASVMSTADNIAEQFHEHFDINVIGLLNLLKALPQSVEHFAFASSMTVYGVPEYEPVNEDHPARPNNLYALGKLAAERYLRMYAQETGLKVAMLRYSSVYGPGRITHRAVPNMIERSLDGTAPTVNGTGKTARDYVYMDDVIDATIAACEKKADGVYNIGSGVGTDIGTLAEEITRITQGPKPVYDASKPDGYSLYYDVSRMCEELGVTPKWDMKRGLQESIAWHKSLR